MKDGFARLLAMAIAHTVVPYLRAIFVMLSPPSTTYTHEVLGWLGCCPGTFNVCPT
jgi:hypothetical protein